ncbi:hypothetical protein K435DRAFT_876358 [Dendrothele bispora CBS 962.96]|uniref:Uncharacterized protein n=1 Tax=Dendrothele bispora (strain CBS 962.96) TaxID=1314807 RepID=A0A4S8KSC7_DENBC|nr:hypothetical protein K435DRAFT_876358 [Dendrothele bispora CBS 962.96]
MVSHFVPAIFSWRRSSGPSSTFRYLWSRTADPPTVTGAAGPFFITFAVILISTGTVCFFDVIYATLPFKLLTGPIRVLIVPTIPSLVQYHLALSMRKVHNRPKRFPSASFGLHRNGRQTTMRTGHCCP